MSRYFTRVRKRTRPFLVRSLVHAMDAVVKRDAERTLRWLDWHLLGEQPVHEKRISGGADSVVESADCPKTERKQHAVHSKS
jgi:hypothetical protein